MRNYCSPGSASRTPRALPTHSPEIHRHATRPGTKALRDLANELPGQIVDLTTEQHSQLVPSQGALHTRATAAALTPAALLALTECAAEDSDNSSTAPEAGQTTSTKTDDAAAGAEMAPPPDMTGKDLQEPSIGAERCTHRPPRPASSSRDTGIEFVPVKLSEEYSTAPKQ